MNDIKQLMKQAQQMQTKLLEAQNKLNDMEISGTSGGGMVTVIINGKGGMQKLFIDPKLLTIDPEGIAASSADQLSVASADVEIVCDLIIAAHNDAKSKLESKMTEEMGGLIPAGMKLPF